MSWNYSIENATPVEAKAGLEQHIQDNPLPNGREKNLRAKLVDVIAEAGKGYGPDFLMNFNGPGSSVREDGVEVSQTLNVSITPVSVY